MNVSLIDGFVPTIGQSFTVLTASSVTGSFATINYPVVPGIGFITIYNPGSVVITVINAVPLRLLGFEGTMQNSSSALLTWKTEAEINVDRYELQWSRSSAAFTAINTQPAANNTGISQYSYQHGNLEKGNHYYRLKMIDRDGSYTYSNVVKLSVNGVQPFTVYPNPVKPGTTVAINLANSAAGTVTVIISAADGKVVMQKVINQINTNNVQVKIPAIAAGQYIITVYAASSMLMTGKLIVE
jgi:Secretion system C-terminal sorting domain